MSTIEMIENLKSKIWPKIGWYDGSDDLQSRVDHFHWKLYHIRENRPQKSTPNEDSRVDQNTAFNGSAPPPRIAIQRESLIRGPVHGNLVVKANYTVTTISE